MRSDTIPQAAGGQDVATIRAGDLIDSVFACTRKDRLIARTGTAYLSVELRDRSGVLEGRAFRGADLLAGRFERGDLVRVRGRAARYKDSLQVEIDKIEAAPPGAVDPAAFLPVAYRDLDELDGFLEHLAAEVSDRGYAGLLERLLADVELRAAWRQAPCTRSSHHAYLGGLLEHTVAVATLAVELGVLHPRLDADLLLTAAIVHDLGKTREFTYGATIETTQAGCMLGHVQLGLQLLEHACARVLDPERWLALAHCVACHHGAEAAPGRRFASAEALALWRCNALDSGVKEALEHGIHPR